jgi:acyl transferase domain-containing protein
MEEEKEANLGDVPKRMAIIGMSCRLPGQVSTADDLWGLCSRAKSTWSEVPKARFNADAFHHPNPDRPGSYNARGAHFLKEDVGLFDAPFFNITLQEAVSLDPQQRIILECTYEALENAGISATSIASTNVGVFAGASFPDYESNNSMDIDSIPMYSGTGCAAALQSNRISYYFNLNGPSLTIDTACSSSLVALHLASQSIRNGECTIAIVTGCHLNLLPQAFVTMSRQR